MKSEVEWILKGFLKNAHLEKNVAGSIWLIPERDLAWFELPERGRPLDGRREWPNEISHKPANERKI